MEYPRNLAADAAADVLSLAPGDVPAYVERCVRTRSLRALIAKLNEALLFGAEDEQKTARKALSHLGFI